MSYLQINHRPSSQYAHYTHHFHSTYEVYYFISGDADYFVEGTEYHLTPHSLLLLAPNVLHGVRVKSDRDYVRYCLYFSPSELLSERRSFLLSSFPNPLKDSKQAVFYEDLTEFQFENFFYLLQQLDSLPQEEQQIYYPIYLEGFLARIHLMCQLRCPSSTCASNVSSTITEIISYLNSHIAQPHTLDDLSQKFYISKYYLNRSFKRATGTTVIDYLIHKRIFLAKQYLLNGENAVDVAAKVGFTDYSSFYRAYKRILGTSPGCDKKSVTDSHTGTPERDYL
ncbi:MAG: AraC family transcriptional regulator [Roseburia sp.]|nr:AraC family transcriptional regulator [Roseburia sp.]